MCIGGHYIVQFLDRFSTAPALMLVVMMEAVAATWVRRKPIRTQRVRLFVVVLLLGLRVEQSCQRYPCKYWIRSELFLSFCLDDSLSIDCHATDVSFVF
jgi:hypothetical protein